VTTEQTAASEPSTGTPVDPVRQLLDWVLYTPIGVLTMIHKDLPTLIATGRERVHSQLNTAKFVGQMAVRQVKNDVDRRLAEHERERLAAEPVIDVVEVPVAAIPVSLPEAIIEAVTEASVSDAAALPIDGYESLAASQVVLRLGSLTAAELAAISDYESSHRGRRTILGKIHQLQVR
jgi:hypothetical protein